MRRLPPPSRDSLRTAPEEEVLALLALGGWAAALPGAAREAQAGAEALLARLRAGGLRFTDDGKIRRFDPAEAVNRMIADGLAGTDDFWRTRWVPSGRALAESFAAPPPALPPRRFAVEWVRTVLAAPPRLRLSLPVEDAHLSGLHVEPLEGCTFERRPEWLEARVRPGAPATIAARFRFTAHAGVPHAGDPPAGRWLDAEEGSIRLDPSVRALATELGAGLPDTEAVEAFRAHLLDNLACGMLHHGGERPSPLGTGWYDCRAGSALLAALCRARGLPVRLVGGRLLYAGAPTEHWWAEVWLGRWTPVDLLAWDLSAGGADARWRNWFASALDYRMKIAVLPRRFDTLPSRVAAHRLTRAVPGGVETRHLAVADGALLWSDRVRVLED